MSDTKDNSSGYEIYEEHGVRRARPKQGFEYAALGVSPRIVQAVRPNLPPSHPALIKWDADHNYVPPVVEEPLPEPSAQDKLAAKLKAEARNRVLSYAAQTIQCLEAIGDDIDAMDALPYDEQVRLGTALGNIFMLMQEQADADNAEG